ncbi:hypothetical protein HK100_005975 [Physocladia obscura]|uniref:Uncharacterized protein n=1 Tax=Physocladia obscura TaxID=109957 RepID=A0AAD5XBL3_9FUNG|nr:hypothetical protein HK100_005975 [Physocladia obscura]
MIVPPVPPKPETGTYFIWPGLQPGSNAANFNPIGNSMAFSILQPVLTYGPSCAPNQTPEMEADHYHGWSVSGQYVNTNGKTTGFIGCQGGNFMNVEPGNELVMEISLITGTTEYYQKITDNATKQSVDYKIDMQGQSQRLIEKTGKTREQIEDMGPWCSGITLQQGNYWYSLACLYGKRINVATGAKNKSRTGGFSSYCRGCKAHYNNLNLLLGRTFDIEAGLMDKARSLIRSKEWSSKVPQDVSYSLVLRILRNCGFIHFRTQSEVLAIRKPLSKAEQAEHLEWVKERTHLGFRTGAELILLTEAGLCIVSFDRSDSTKKIDQLGQTIVADSWGFNRLSNSLTERATGGLLHEVLAGDYAEGDAAFQRRNGEGEPRRLSDEWEDAIEYKWKDIVTKNAHVRGLVLGFDIRVVTLRQFQRLCRLNANDDGNLVDEISGMELTPQNWGVDRIINGIVPGISGELTVVKSLQPWKC